jgi:hypothetical protein
VTADLPGDLGPGAALSPELGDDFPVEKRKMTSVHRKAPGWRLLPANNNLPNRPCDATFSSALHLRVESATGLVSALDNGRSGMHLEIMA